MNIFFVQVQTARQALRVEGSGIYPDIFRYTLCGVKNNNYLLIMPFLSIKILYLAMSAKS